MDHHVRTHALNSSLMLISGSAELIIEQAGNDCARHYAEEIQELSGQPLTLEIAEKMAKLAGAIVGDAFSDTKIQFLVAKLARGCRELHDLLHEDVA